MPALAKFPRHEAELASALKDVGVREQPTGSNTGPRVRVYQAATWLGGTGWPWCAAFCCYQAEQAGFALPYKGAGAYAWLDWARGAGWDTTAPIPGDWVVWDIGAGHISILREPIKDGYVDTVDGNASDSVMLCSRPFSLVRGFIHLPEKEATLPPPAKPPMFEVVTSESGHRVIYVSGASAIGKRLPRFLKRHPRGLTIRRRKK